MEPVRFKKLSPDVKTPSYGTPEAAGLDIYSAEDRVIAPGEHTTIKTGIAIAIPKGYTGLIWDKSGIAFRGLKTMGGVFDSDYRGEIMVIVKNVTDKPFEVPKNTKLCQMLFHKIEQAPVEVTEDWDTATTRGEGRFGSTGLK